MTGRALYRSTPTVAQGITQLVGFAGGNIDAELRFSMRWNSWSDVDFHLFTPNGHIYFYNRDADTGALDVDMNIGSTNKGVNNEKNSVPAVENISFATFSSVPDGEYLLGYKQYGVYAGREPNNSDVPTILVTRKYRSWLGGQIYNSHLVIDFPERTNAVENDQLFVAKFEKRDGKFHLLELSRDAVITLHTGEDIVVPEDPPRTLEVMDKNKSWDR